MNTMRVFLHDQLWAQDPQGFKRRIDQFLTIAHRHGIKPLFVLFDSCWDPDPKLGPQHPPVPGVHNSGWVQSPGLPGLRDPAHHARYRAYVQGVIGAFAKDDRILGWDLWNEPDNPADQYKGQEGKEPLVRALLAQVYGWARAVDPTQPLTSRAYGGTTIGRPTGGKLTPMETAPARPVGRGDLPRLQLAGNVRSARQAAPSAMVGRSCAPNIMARGNGSTFDGSLPIGKTLQRRDDQLGLRRRQDADAAAVGQLEAALRILEEPTIWFHEVFRADGARRTGRRKPT